MMRIAPYKSMMNSIDSLSSGQVFLQQVLAQLKIQIHKYQWKEKYVITETRWVDCLLKWNL